MEEFLEEFYSDVLPEILRNGETDFYSSDIDYEEAAKVGHKISNILSRGELDGIIDKSRDKKHRNRYLWHVEDWEALANTYRQYLDGEIEIQHERYERVENRELVEYARSKIRENGEMEENSLLRSIYGELRDRGMVDTRLTLSRAAEVVEDLTELDDIEKSVDEGKYCFLE